MDSHSRYYTKSYKDVNTNSYLMTGNAKTHTSAMEFSEWLQAKIDADGLTQDKLAEMSGVPQPTINRILTGVTPDPRQSTVKKLDKALGGGWTTVAISSPGAPAPARIKPAPDPLIAQVVALMEKTDATGRAMALAAVRVALNGYRPAKANHAG